MVFWGGIICASRGVMLRLVLPTTFWVIPDIVLALTREPTEHMALDAHLCTNA